MRTLFRIYCIYHMGELVYLAFITYMDPPPPGQAKTAGPDTLRGVLGEKLGDPQMRYWPIKNFKPIKAKLEPIDPAIVKKFSQDKLVHYHYVMAISEGPSYFDPIKHPERQWLITADPGPRTNARWTADQNRQMKSYMSQEPGTVAPAEEEIIRFIQEVYAPYLFFNTKNSSILDAPKAIHLLLTRLEEFDLDEGGKAAMQNVINNNSYHAHYENVTCAMLHDPDEDVRQRALEELISIHPDTPGAPQQAVPRRNAKKKVRRFIKPDLNAKWTVPHYSNLIDGLEKGKKTMPPVFIGLSIDQLKAIARDPSITRLQKVKSNDQSVERTVRDVAEVSPAARGPLRREQLLALRFRSRRRMPVFKTKAHWKDH